MTYSTKTSENRSYLRPLSPQLKGRQERIRKERLGKLKKQAAIGLATLSAGAILLVGKGDQILPGNHNNVSADSQADAPTLIVGDQINKETGLPYNTIGQYASLIAARESKDQGGGPVDSATVAEDLLTTNSDLLATNRNLSVTATLENGTPIKVVVPAEQQAAQEIIEDNQ